MRSKSVTLYCKKNHNLMSAIQISIIRRTYPSDISKNGWKRFILVDTLGLVIGCIVVAANISEKAGAKLLLAKLKTQAPDVELCSNIKKVWVDGGYRGEDLLKYVTDLWQWIWEITLRSDDTKGFVVIPKRWVVERTFSWFGQSRRLSKDYEKTALSSECQVYLSMTILMLKRI